MAVSKCAACNAKSFELAEASIAGSKFKHYFVQCAKCGAVVGVIPFDSTNALIRLVQKDLKAVKQKVDILK
jgi:hypothetical protein